MKLYLLDGKILDMTDDQILAGEHQKLMEHYELHMNSKGQVYKIVELS